MFPKDPNLEAEFTFESERSGVVEDRPFQLLVLGDWTADGAKRELANRRPVEIDRDNFDDVMNGLGVNLDLDVGTSRAELDFASLDDFHPDELFNRVPVFEELRGLRKRLRNADTFNSAAREVREWSGSPVSADGDKAIAGPEPEADNLLDAILSKPDGGAAAPKPAISSDLSRLVGDLVRPHLVAVDENEQASMVVAVDEAISGTMRSVLHDRRFQSLEAAWRGLFFLVRRVETASDLKIYILDVSKEELAKDLRSDGGGSAVGRVFAAGQNGEPWAAVAGNFAFLPDVDDVAALIRIAKASAMSRTPFVSHIRPEVIGVHSLADQADADGWDLSGTSAAGKLWTALRGLPESQYLGLTMPRFLARLPYGSATEPSETFSFEEFTETANHDGYLWANSCFAVSLLLAQSYREFEWEFGQRFVQDIDGLPLHMYKRDGQSVYQSCAEVQLSQNAAEALMEYGVMPVVSFKNLDRIRLGRLQSVSDPVTVLKGAWSRSL